MTQTSTPPTNDTVIDRSMSLFDRMVHEPEAVNELESLFAPDATIQLAEEMEPVTGLPAIMAIFGQGAKDMADSKQFWTVTELDDGKLECHWVKAARKADGRLFGHSGISQTTVNADGQITHLVNRMVPVPGWV